MPETDLTLLMDAARQAGALAMQYHGGDLDVQLKAQDNSPVTDADLAVNALLEQVLREARPNYGWLSEESADDKARLRAKAVFIIDPIDGTRSFMQGSGTWAHSIAIARNGVVESAVVFLPMKALMYTAQSGMGAALNGAALRVGSRAVVKGADVLITKPGLEPQRWPGGVPDVTRHHRPSLAYRLALVAQGRFDAMITFRPAWEWDIAAGALILSEAGAQVSDQTGVGLRFNNPHPQVPGVVSANPELHGSLLDLMRQDAAHDPSRSD